MVYAEAGSNVGSIEKGTNTGSTELHKTCKLQQVLDFQQIAHIAFKIGLYVGRIEQLGDVLTCADSRIETVIKKCV